MELGTVKVEVDETFALVEDDDDCILTDPIRPSSCGLGASLDGHCLV